MLWWMVSSWSGIEGAVLVVEQGHDYCVMDCFVCPISHQFLRQGCLQYTTWLESLFGLLQRGQFEFIQVSAAVTDAQSGCSAQRALSDTCIWLWSCCFLKPQLRSSQYSGRLCQCIPYASLCVVASRCRSMHHILVFLHPCRFPFRCYISAIVVHIMCL